MPQIQFDPALLECLDFASPTYAAACVPLVNVNTTEEQAIQCLKAIWSTGNEADKVRWQTQSEEDEVARANQLRVQTEADVLKAQTEIEEAETLRKEEMKKNKSKYIPIPDRDVPSVARVVAANYAVRKMEKGLYVELWYYTNAGLDEAFCNSNTVDDEAMIMVRLPNGSTSWVPAASSRTASGVIEDRNIFWEDFCQAAPRMIIAMEEANWPQERVAMLAKFWGNLQIHDLRSSRDPLDQKTLIVYQAEQRRLWHLAILPPQGAYNLSRINEEIMGKTREKVYWDEHRVKDYQRDLRSDQRAQGSSSGARGYSHSQHPQDFRQRSLSPERLRNPPKYSAIDKPAAAGRKLDFQTSTAGRVYSACAVCLGCHPHKIVECTATKLWDNSYPSIATRSNKILSM